MGRPRSPLPVTLVCGLLSRDRDLLRRARQLVSRCFGAIACESEIWPFTQTTYYDVEMGTGLLRQFIGFENVVRPEALPSIKLQTNKIEQQMAEDCALLEVVRPVNIDPGYLDPARLVLATTKDRSHRLYLGDGIYGEVTLQWRKDAWQPQEWTYPDYREPHYHQWFSILRQRMLERQNSLGSPTDQGSDSHTS